MSQTSYPTAPNARFSGMISDLRDSAVDSKRNSDAGAIPFGIMLAQSGTVADDAALFSTPDAVMVGIAAHDFARDNIGLSATTSDGVKSGNMVNVLTRGRLSVAVEETVAVDDPVYVRHTANGGNTQLGAFRKSSDSNTCVRIHGARWTRGGTTTSPAELEFDLMKARHGDPHSFGPYVTASHNANATEYPFLTDATREFIVEGVALNCVAGLASDDTDYFVIQLMNGSTEVASWSTKTTGGQGTLTAATWKQMVLDAAANLRIAPGSSLTLVMTKNGTQTLPATNVLLFGRYI